MVAAAIMIAMAIAIAAVATAVINKETAQQTSVIQVDASGSRITLDSNNKLSGKIQIINTGTKIAYVQRVQIGSVITISFVGNHTFASVAGQVVAATTTGSTRGVQIQAAWLTLPSSTSVYITFQVQIQNASIQVGNTYTGTIYFYGSGTIPTFRIDVESA
jgi:hypothetical protein